MRNKLLFIFVSILLFSCTDNPMEAEPEESLKNALMEVDNSFINVTDSIDRLENLIHYQYQNKTAWGGIEVWYSNNEIVKIRTLQNAELGFIKTTHFFENSSNYKSVQINHSANWDEFEEKYGEIDAINDERMTYTDDTTETVAHHSALDSFDLKMIEEASELLIFVSNENKLVP